MGWAWCVRVGQGGRQPFPELRLWFWHHLLELQHQFSCSRRTVQTWRAENFFSLSTLFPFANSHKQLHFPNEHHQSIIWEASFFMAPEGRWGFSRREENMLKSHACWIVMWKVFSLEWFLNISPMLLANYICWYVLFSFNSEYILICFLISSFPQDSF